MAKRRAMRVLRNAALLGAGGAGVLLASRAYRTHRATEEALSCTLPKRGLPETPSADKKDAIVIGGGVAGLCSAYHLARRGYKVTIIEARDNVAQECSACPAGGMMRSNPTVNSTSWLAVLSTLNPFTSEASAFKFFHIDWLGCATDPHFIRWVLDFSYNSLIGSEDLAKRQAQQLEFTDWAVESLLNFMKEEGIDGKCGHNAQGAVHIRYSGNKHELALRPATRDGEPAPDAAGTAQPAAGAKPPAEGKSVYAAGKLSREEERELTAEEVLEMNPLVRTWKGQVSGGTMEVVANSGDCERFTNILADVCRDRYGVTFLTNTRIKRLVAEEGGATAAGVRDRRITEIITDKHRLQIAPTTEVVMAAGSWTSPLLSQVGYYTPLYPMRGYCVVVDLPPKGDPTRPAESSLPQRTLVDKYIYVTRLGDQVRIASIGEFAGWNTTPSKHVDDIFRTECALHLAPLAELFHATPSRVGLRPYISDGVALAGRVAGVNNLSVNVGPGFNGWKVAFGAGHVLATAITDDAAARGGYNFDMAAFDPSPRVTPCAVWESISAW